MIFTHHDLIYPIVRLRAIFHLEKPSIEYFLKNMVETGNHACFKASGFQPLPLLSPSLHTAETRWWYRGRKRVRQAYNFIWCLEQLFCPCCKLLITAADMLGAVWSWEFQLHAMPACLIVVLMERTNRTAVRRRSPGDVWGHSRLMFLELLLYPSCCQLMQYWRCLMVMGERGESRNVNGEAYKELSPDMSVRLGSIGNLVSLWVQSRPVPSIYTVWHEHNV